MSDFTTFFLKELKRFNGPRNLVVWLVFLVIVLVFINTGVNNHKKVPEKEEKFKTIQSNYFKKTPNYEGYGRDGIKVLFIPSPTEVLFQNAIVPPDLAAKIDNIVSVNIGNNLKGKSLSPSGIGGRLDFSNLVLLLGSIFALFYGYESLYHKEYLRFLSSLVSHRKTFAAVVISRSILFIAAFLFLFVGVLLFLAVSGIGFTASDYSALTGFLVAKLGMLLFFFMAGVFFGTFRSVLFSAVSMFAAWFFLVFIIPGLINAAVGKKIPDIILDYQTELNKFKILIDFEHQSEKKYGKFNRNNIEVEQKIAEEYFEIDYKKIESLEKALRDEIAAAIQTYYTLSAWTPVTFYLCTGNEVSSRGYASFLDFYEYAIRLKREFVWFFIQRAFYHDPEEMVSFIKKDENIYRAASRLPANFARGLLINFLFIAILFMISLFRCEKALFPSAEKANAYDCLDLDLETGNQYTFNVYYPEAVDQLTAAFFGAGKRLDWEIAIDNRNIVTEKLKKGDFLYLPNGGTLPGDLKAGHLLCLFKRLLKLSKEEVEKARRELGKEVLNRRLSAVETVDRARLLLTLAELAKGKVRVFLFNDFILGIPVLMREGLSERGERLKADGVLVVDMISRSNAWLDADIVSSIVLKNGKYKVI